MPNLADAESKKTNTSLPSRATWPALTPEQQGNVRTLVENFIRGQGKKGWHSRDIGSGNLSDHIAALTGAQKESASHWVGPSLLPYLRKPGILRKDKDGRWIAQGNAAPEYNETLAKASIFSQTERGWSAKGKAADQFIREVMAASGMMFRGQFWGLMHRLQKDGLVEHHAKGFWSWTRAKREQTAAEILTLPPTSEDKIAEPSDSNTTEDPKNHTSIEGDGKYWEFSRDAGIHVEVKWPGGGFVTKSAKRVLVEM